MTDKEKWLEYRNRISMGLGLEGEQTRWIFDKAKEAIELEKENESLKKLAFDLGKEIDRFRNRNEQLLEIIEKDRKFYTDLLNEHEKVIKELKG